MTRLFIARHGNTFDPGDVVLRVGARTDVPLSSSGVEQSATLGRHLRAERVICAAGFCSRLLRTRQTLQIVLEELGQQPTIIVEEGLDEIDYGPDEGKTETDVVDRVGQFALDRWEKEHVVPDGWRVDVAGITRFWTLFLDRVAIRYPDRDVLVATSNGIARFAPVALGLTSKNRGFKLSTGRYGALAHCDSSGWSLESWNVQP